LIRNGFGMDLNGFVMVLEWVCNGFGIDLNGLFMVWVWIFNGFGMDLVWCWYECGAILTINLDSC